MSKVDYCNVALAGLPQYELDWVQSVVNAAARLTAYLDLDLVPPVPDGTLGDEISPPVSIVGSSPCTMPS